MSDLPLIVTNAGRAALVNAANTGTAPVTIASVGVSATQITASTTTAALPGEIKRIATISGDVVADDTIHLIVRDDSAAVYSVRSFALYLNDGTLFAAYGQANVIIEKSSLALLLPALDVRFADVAATQLTFGDANFLNPPATEASEGVARFATDAEARAGTSLIRMLSPKRAKDAILSWLGFTPANKAGETFTGKVAAPDVEITTGDLYLSRLSNPWGYILRPNAVGYRYLGFTTMGDATPLDQVNFNANLVTVKAARMWHAGNDGAGSGLDADLLDGFEATYFTNIPARLGYTPASRAGETFTGPIAAPNVEITSGDLYLSRQTNAWGYILRPNVAGYRNLGFTTDSDAAPLDQVNFNANLVTVKASVMWHAGNDGSGSGLDADLLDGFNSDAFMRGAADRWIGSDDGRDRLNFARNGATYHKITSSIRFQNGTATDVLTIDETGTVTTFGNLSGRDLMASTGANTGAVFFGSSNQHYLNYDGANWVLRGGGSLFIDTGGGNLAKAWTPANDGAGSGLDADLLDGNDSAFFSDIIARLGFTPANKAGQEFDGPIRVAGGFRLIFVDGNPGLTFTDDSALPLCYTRDRADLRGLERQSSPPFRWIFHWILTAPHSKLHLAQTA